MEPGRSIPGFGDVTWLQESMMANQTVTFPSPVIMPGRPAIRGENGHEFLRECRNLVRILTFAIDSLCEEGEINETKLRHLRNMISSLSALTHLAEQQEFRIAGSRACNYVDDFNGTRYYAVNACELERFSEK